MPSWGGAGGGGELCVAMQMHWPVCQELQTVEDRNTGEEGGGKGGRAGGGRRNAIKMKGGVNKTEGTLLLAAAHFLLKIDGVPAGRRVEEPPRCSELHLPEPLIRSPASAAQGSPPPLPGSLTRLASGARRRRVSCPGSGQNNCSRCKTMLRGSCRWIHHRGAQAALLSMHHTANSDSLQGDF